MTITYMPEIYGKLTKVFGRLPYCLAKDTFIYGGAIRDAIAEKEIEGDLDIATPSKNTPNNQLIMSISKLAYDWKIQNSLGDIKIYANYAPIVSIINLKHDKTGKLAQIIRAKRKSGVLWSSALDIVEHVDIVCCGIALDCFGNIHEVVPNAIDHCKHGILVLNKANKQVDKDSEQYKKRIQKLIKRGWKEEK